MSSFLAHRTRIKFCGLTREADVDPAVEAGADAIGLVLYNKSPRYVDAARAGVLARRLPPFVTPVVLLVNASPSLVQAALKDPDRRVDVGIEPAHDLRDVGRRSIEQRLVDPSAREGAHRQVA